MTPEAFKAYKEYQDRTHSTPLLDNHGIVDYSQLDFSKASLGSREPRSRDPESKAALREPQAVSSNLGYNPVLPPPKRNSAFVVPTKPLNVLNQLSHGYELYSLDSEDGNNQKVVENVQDVVIQCAKKAGHRALFDKGNTRPKRAHSLDRGGECPRRRYNDPNNRFNALRSHTPPPNPRDLPTRMDLYTVGDRGVSRDAPSEVHPEDSVTGIGTGSGIGVEFSHDIMDFQKRFAGVVEGLYHKDMPGQMRKDLVEMLLKSELKDRPVDARRQMVSVAHSVVSSHDSESWCNLQSDYMSCDSDFTNISSTAGQVNRPPPVFNSDPTFLV